MALKPFTGELDAPDQAETTALKPFDGVLDDEKSSTLRRVVGDTGVSLLKGAIAVPEAAVGVADIATAGNAGKALEGLGFRPKEAKAALNELYSPEQKRANQKVAEADGFVDTVKTAIENPSTIAQTVIESAPLIGAGGVVGYGARAAGVASPIVAGAAGEGLVGAGLAAEDTRTSNETGLLNPKETALAIASGAGTAVTGVAGGKLAQKLGITDIDTLAAGGKEAATQKGLIRRAIEGGLAEGVFEELPQSTQEQILANVAQEKPWNEGVANAAAMGLLAGTAMGAGTAAVFNGEQGGDRLEVSQGDTATADADDAEAARMQQEYDAQQSATPLDDFDIENQALEKEIKGRREAAGIDKPIPADAIDAAEILGEEDGATGQDDQLLAGTAAGTQPDIGARGDGTELLQPDGGLDTATQATEQGLASAEPAGLAGGEPDSTVAPVDVGANDAATSLANDLPEPTDAQKDAGNYKVGRAKIGGLDISIENPQGSVRRSKADDPNPWETQMNDHYGYIKGVPARAPDKEHVDVYVKPGTADEFAGSVFVVDQVNPETGKFDEPKVMIGYDSQEEAEAAYRSNYSEDWQGFGGITEVPMPRFKAMLQGKSSFLKPLAGKKQDTKPVDTQKQADGSGKEVYDDKAYRPWNMNFDDFKTRQQNGIAGRNYGNNPEEEAELRRQHIDFVEDALESGANIKDAVFEGYSEIDAAEHPLAASMFSEIRERQNKALTTRQEQDVDDDLNDDSAADDAEDTETPTDAKQKEAKRKRLNAGMAAYAKKAGYKDGSAKNTWANLEEYDIDGEELPAVMVQPDNKRKEPYSIDSIYVGQVPNGKWIASSHKLMSALSNDSFGEYYPEFFDSRAEAINDAVDRRIDELNRLAKEQGSEPNSEWISKLEKLRIPATPNNPSSRQEAEGLKQSAPDMAPAGGTDAENEVRELVASLTKRRAAARQINKEKMFDAALAAAKELMNGKAVSAGKFKTWKNLLKADTEIANILGQLEQMAGQSPEALAAKERKSRVAAERAKLSKQIDTTKDDILAAMAKLGGLKKDAALAEFGFDPADMDKQGSGIYRTFNNSERAKDLDTMREALAELGYPVGETVADFGNALDEAMSGVSVMTSEGVDARMQAEMAERYQQEYNELSDEEQAILDGYVLEATRIFGADRVAQIDAAVAEYMADQPTAAVERELTRVLREEIDIARQGQGTGSDRSGQEAGSTAEGTTRQADPDGSDQDSPERQGEVDLLGDDTQAAQAVADAAAAKDQRRNSGEDNPEEFTLTGSNRPADVAAARGAQDLFSQQDQPTDSNQPVAQESSSAGPIGDFGEKIGGARKDIWATYKDKLEDAVALDVREQPLSKSWPEPDYQELLDNGVDPDAVAFAHAARDEIPTKPSKSWKLKSWAKSVELLRDTSLKLMNGELSIVTARKLMSESDTRGIIDLLGRMDLYKRVGHAQSLKGVRVARGEYSLLKGVTYDPPKVVWTVEKQTKATAFSNWPLELASGDTREAAIDQFAERYATMTIQQPAKKEVSFDLYSKRGQDGIWIGKKVGRNYIDLEKFDTIKEARAYRTENHDALVAKLEKAKEIPQVRRDINNPRVGEDMREGRDVTPELFMEAFGFKGVEFGNWVEQKRRQKDLNDAYDALMDMAAVLNINPKSISLNGELGLAFGARGTGGVDPAAAHYEPGFMAINLTKKQGAGSLGHEWWHALDHYFSRMRNRGDQYTTEALDVSLASRDSRYQIQDEGVRPEMIEAFGQVVKAIKNTALKARSSRLDGKRSKEYWTTGREMSARAFESYLISKLQDQGASNDYLANIVSEKTWEAASKLGFEMEDSYPYPTAGELPLIRAGFDHFFNTIESVETDTGVALRQDVAQYNRYETDLFGEPLPIKTRRSAATTSGSRDVQPASSVSDTEAPLGQYYVKTIIGQEQQRKLGVNRITTPAEAAAATHYLYKSAVERFDAIVTDKNGKPLAVVGGFKGALTQTAVYPSVVIAEAVRVPGAAKIWFSHNHPSGKSDLSTADKALYRMMHSVFEGSGIKPMGLLAVSLNEFHAITDPNDEFNIDFGEIAPPSSEVMVPVIERDMMDSRKSLINVSSPAEAKQVAKNFYEQSQQPAIVMLDAQNNVAAWVPLSEKMTGKLKNTGGLNALYRAISEGNPAGTIIVHGGELDATVSGKVTIAQNIGGALQKIDARPLDVINVNKTQSAAEDGSIYFSGEVYSRTGRGQTNTDAFKRWFGDSKVVDEDGKPLVVYHGSNTPIDAFDSKKMRNGRLGKGFYFTADKEEAQAYAEAAVKAGGGEATVIPVYLKVENPLIGNGVGQTGTTDGKKYGRWWVVNSPEQIKSATGNNGDFDPENPDIRFSRAGAPTGMPLADAQAIVDEIAKQYPAVPPVVVVASSDELPMDAATKREIQQQRAELQEAYSRYLAEPNERNFNATLSAEVNDIEGLFSSDGKIYLNAGAIKTEQRLREVFAHEAVGHLSVENMLNEANPKLFNQLVKQVNLLDKSGNKYIRRLASAVDSSQPGLDAAQRAREIIAQIAERGDQDKDMTPVVRSLWEKIRDAIKAFTKLVFNVDMTDQDVRDIVSMANRYAKGEDVMSVFRSGDTVFSRSGREPGQGDTFMTAALEYLARDPDLFQQPSSDKKAVAEIAADIDPGYKVMPMSQGAITAFYQEMIKDDPALAKMRPDRGWEITVPDSASRAGFIFVKGNEVWLDVSRLQPGVDNGNVIYGTAAAYAHNNGKVLIGDPAGFSRKAFFRRTENMLSSALKYGTTKHLRPHPAQLDPTEHFGNTEWAKSLRPIKWKEGDDIHNIKELVYTSWKSAIDNIPSLKDVIYNPDTGSFETVSGDTVTDDDFARRVSEHANGSKNPYSAGSATQKRAALFNTFLREEGRAAGRQTLDRLVDQLSRYPLGITQLRGVMYSRAGQDQTNTPEFKRWFGDSKVVDADGKPMVVYHSGAFDDDVILSQKQVKMRQDKTSTFYNNGIYFSPDARYSSLYAIGDGAVTYPAYLKITNPLVIKTEKQLAGFAKFKDKVKQLIQNDPLQKSVKNDDKFSMYIDGDKMSELKARGYDGIINEVWGEIVVFDPTQIKSAIGNRGTFDGDNPNIVYSRTGRGQPPNTPRQQRLMPSWNAPEASKMDDVIYALQDKHIDLKRVSQDIKKSGNEIDDRWNAYLQEELFHGRTAKRTKDFIKTEIEPLIEDMRMRGVAMADFEEFLWMRHAQERNEQIAKVNPDMPDGGSGVSTKEAKAYLAALPADKKRAYEALAKRIDKITAGTRQTLVNYGLESADTIAAWGAAYEHYVPLMREDMDTGFGNGTGQGYSVRGNSSKRATGSKRAVVDILANLAQQREKAIIRGEKNRVSTALIGLAKLNPNPDFWKTDSIPMIKQIGRDGLVEEVPDANYKNRDNVIVARIVNKQGKVVEHSVIFNQFDERAMRMAASLKNLDQDQIGELLGTASVITRYFASINTQYNPIFGIINILRDVQGAVLNLTSTPLAGKQKQVLRDTVYAMRGIYTETRKERKGEKADSEWAQLWEEFRNEGGQTGYRDMFKNARERGDNMEHALDPAWWQKKGWGKVISANGVLAPAEQWLVSKPGKFVFDWLSDYNETLENSVRLAAYKAAKDMGMSKQQAASLAKNLTVNFNRKGEMGRQIGALYAFFNASVQGTARLAETLFINADGKIGLSKAGKSIVYGGLLLGAMQALLLAWAGFDDDEPPEFVRDRNIVIPIGDGKYLTFPMPLGFNVIPALGRILTEWALDDFRDPQKRALHGMEVFLDMFNPIGNAGLSMQTLAPTALDPVAALAENKDWTGRPIAREDFNSLNPTPGFTRAKDTATAFSKALSHGINELTGGTDYRPGALSPTPDQIDYLFGQVAGGVGREYQKLEQTASSAVTGENLPPFKVPLLGRFYGDATGQSSQGNQFYKNVRLLNEHQNQLKGMRKEGLDLKEYRAKHPESSLIAQGNYAERTVQSLRKRRRELLKRDAHPSEIERIDYRITEVMRKLNDNVRMKRESTEKPLAARERGL